MPSSIQKALLAAAALVAIAVAVVRGVEAGGHDATANTQALTYGTSAADAAAVLAKTRTPPGFRKTPCREPHPGWFIACFSRRRSIVLDEAEMRRLVAATGARPLHVIGPPVHCLGHKKPHVRQSVLQACVATSILGTERLLLSAKSVAVAEPRGATGTTRSSRPLPPGTEIEVDVIGHLSQHRG